MSKPSGWISRTMMITGLGIAAALATGFGQNDSQQSASAQTAPKPAPTSPPQLPTRTPPEQEPHTNIPYGQGLGKPPLEIRPEIMDLGSIRPNQRVSGTVYVQNVGDKWLKVLDLHPDCTCTKATISNPVIAPGQSVTIEAVY